jgi:hypothetical protein
MIAIGGRGLPHGSLVNQAHDVASTFLLGPLALVVLAIGTTSCSSSDSGGSSTSPSASSVTQTIGPEGGTILVQGATVTFPKDALNTPKSITISAVDAAPDGYVLLSRVFECGPSGTEFAQPVTMQMPFTDDGKGGTLFWSDRSDPSFKDLGGRVEGKTVIATVTHFSSGFVGRKLK